jgi:hypothetical protein
MQLETGLEGMTYQPAGLFQDHSDDTFALQFLF